MIIGIMGAMPDEVDQLCAKLENVTVEPYGGVEYHKGTLAGKQVVVCCAGMGKANAAATTQVLITCLLYTSPSPRDMRRSRMPSSA